MPVSLSEHQVFAGLCDNLSHHSIRTFHVPGRGNGHSRSTLDSRIAPHHSPQCNNSNPSLVTASPCLIPMPPERTAWSTKIANQMTPHLCAAAADEAMQSQCRRSSRHMEERKVMVVIYANAIDSLSLMASTRCTQQQRLLASWTQLEAISLRMFVSCYNVIVQQ